MDKEQIINDLKQTRREYSKVETQYNKECNPEKRNDLKNILIKLDERIEEYKKLLDM